MRINTYFIINYLDTDISISFINLLYVWHQGLARSLGATTSIGSSVKASTFRFISCGNKKIGIREESTEPVFLNVYGAQESIPRNEFRQSM